MFPADFGGALFSEVTEEIIATFYVADRLRVEFKDKEFKKAYKKLKKQLPEGDIYLGSSTSDDRLWLVRVTSDTDPGATYVYDMETDKVEFLYRPASVALGALLSGASLLALLCWAAIELRQQRGLAMKRSSGESG